ncbi:MAG: YicC/YloC family endoribonuclease [Clostridium sp.]|uniref:YicC/YloC family endoribonuclease n=1 Tax=Clostridium TaxID=1485 RepID=UPI00215360D5|nr:YicC/YloC family endoribonuclease [Clostridium sp. LY3-2]MCR6515383.1 YicC family protein [Clostridium sp. LY3-2]
MAKSMTSFGRARSSEENERIFSVEMKSVNHRYLDINIRMPKQMIALEERIRKVINSRLSRGKVDVFINLKSFKSDDVVAELNKDLAKSYFDCLEEIANSLNIPNDATATTISRFQDVITISQKEEDLEEVYTEITPLLKEALDNMIEMRMVEGEKLKEDILGKLLVIDETVDEVEKIADSVPRAYKEKLEERVKELTSNINIDEQRIAMEVAMFSDKATVDEEIIRLRSHIIQMRNTLKLKEPIGRKLDFIVQEMNRETNTIASKSSHIEMTNFVIEMKNIIEKIREQVQNIE